MSDEKKPEVAKPHVADYNFASELQRKSAEAAKREKLNKEPYVKELLARIAELEMVGGGKQPPKK